MGMDKETLALCLLPARWREDAKRQIRQAEEIRLRAGREPSMLLRGEELPFSGERVTEPDLLRILEKATGASLHSAQASLAEGFVNYRGIRIGVCGMAAMKEGQGCVFHHVSSLAVRIPRECRGICREQIETLLREGYQNTLVVGPPGAGKTTALRELIRSLSDSGCRVGVADERNELASRDEDGQAWDLGRCSDVLGGVPKGKAALMLLRGMNPGIIAMDEITREEDAEAILQICGCGVGILASAHAGGREELLERAAYKRLLDRHVFSRLLFVRAEKNGRQYRLESLSP